MDKRLFSVCCGIASIIIWPWLPSWDWWIPLACLMGISWQKRPATACLLLGIIWSLCYSHWQLQWLHTPMLFQRGQLIAGTVDSVKVQEHNKSSLIVSLKRLNGQALSPTPRVLLSWYSEQAPPKTGEFFQSITQLRLPHSLHNPGSFNSARWLLGQGISARGSLTGTLSHQVRAESLRTQMVAHIKEETASLSAQPWLLALSVGERTGLSTQDWAMLRGLGISHLFAISGLHIGLVAGLGLLVGRLTGNPWVAAMLAASLALAYAWLAGFSVPTQRALLMLLLWLGVYCWGRFWSGRRILLLTMTLLLVMRPWLALDQGFWLSVLAVAALLVTTHWLGGRKIWRLQFGMTLLLLPLVMLIFGGVSGVSLPINLVLIPLFSLLFIPLLLVAALFMLPAPAFASAIFNILDALFMPMIKALHWLNDTLSPWVWLSTYAQGVGFFILLLPLLLLPKARWLMVLPVCVVLLQWGAQPHWQVRVLDVGQGLSVLVTQGQRGLLFDTGNRFNSGFNMADGVILPLLRRLGIQQLDHLVISHNDQDHSGNRDYLARTLPIEQRWGAWPDGQQCRAGQQARWGALSLKVLWPKTITGHSNNDSCVIHISDGVLSLLLTGDIEAKAEQALLASRTFTQAPASLSAQLLVSPHHGSKSSSSKAFIEAVSPKWVVHTAGFNNRWGFPAPEVVTRFREQGAQQLITGELGMVHWVAKGEEWHLVQTKRAGAWYNSLNTWLNGAKPLE
ncbi:DNA internalization-related competence protein ComEC/Rec2 [Oceanisphaera pacifica]|uniref:DNA internalization-related competence protein ComEC/Rec2 n=1 Tax=Oceanisphaera pacifica TaxID=2818389 RepID=A0ABS3NEY5_9GAMM|nr:DNA internalization-related competence protein ComEC/Rec2 [Oceanisphaera pacifica]MBO1519141.1 DNA internalization-related competence protein ComEC/Rec2 [Oceanisphaera pacifica]